MAIMDFLLLSFHSGVVETAIPLSPETSKHRLDKNLILDDFEMNLRVRPSLADKGQFLLSLCGCCSARVKKLLMYFNMNTNRWP